MLYSASYRYTLACMGELRPSLRAAIKRYRASPRGKYTSHKCNAIRRGIKFLLTFEEWWDIWNERPGEWDQRGNKLNMFVMMRIGDVGAYEKGNVVIGRFVKNFNDGKKRPRIKRKPGPKPNIRHTAKTTTVTWGPMDEWRMCNGCMHKVKQCICGMGANERGERVG